MVAITLSSTSKNHAHATPVLVYEEGERRTSDMTKMMKQNFGDNYDFIIFNRDLVRDQDDEVYSIFTPL